jgi:hypothetical protein
MEPDPLSSTSQPPVCPGCGSSAAAVLTQTIEYQVSDRREVEQPIHIVIVYKCPCGQAYTHKVRFHPPRPDEVTGEGRGDKS